MINLQHISKIKFFFDWFYAPDNVQGICAIGHRKLSSWSAIAKTPNFKFGFLSYDLKNKIEQLYSKKNASLQWPDIGFVEADFIQQNNKVTKGNFTDFIGENPTEFTENKFKIKCRVSKKEYLETVEKLKRHIQFGDIYEINYCIEFYSENAEINPIQVFEKLHSISEAPFAVLAKFGSKYVMSSSPERYIKKDIDTLISQPIKGTRKRSNNLLEDDFLKAELKNSIKEQSENVMIVDLVRNDLSKIAKKNSVHVDELFGLYSFKQVHHLISTVSCKLNSNTTFEEVVKATFPVGSMTGAPKVKAMQLIDQYEKLNRGLYAGSIGYMDENNNFDFNVVIRSIIYDTETKYLSFSVGSAITAYCDAKHEWDECMLKANAMFTALNSRK